MKTLRIYTDTSVVGGCFDEDFKKASLNFFDSVKKGFFKILFSDLIVEELNLAPKEVQEIISLIPSRCVEFVKMNVEAIELRDAYIQAGVLTNKSLNDATHVALATIARADAIISWNFKHIVRLDKIKGFNQINLLQGYGVLTIISPQEVMINEE